MSDFGENKFKEKSLVSEKHYVFYDGDCGFCNFWVQWILERDHKDNFLFASLQSETGQKFLKERNLHAENFDTLYLWLPGAYYFEKSKAVEKIASILGGKYALLAHLNFLPKPVSDFIYDQVSKRRKKLMKDHCLLPDPRQRKKILL